jgi:hypothetical protein
MLSLVGICGLSVLCFRFSLVAGSFLATDCVVGSVLSIFGVRLTFC